tara:strand:+ start:64 stop:405 length:342 start_codon:yes stop_codon:yes gene_type:complete
MSFYIIKLLFTGVLIVSITEITKLNSKLGAILTAMPLTTLLVACWLYYDKTPDIQIANYIKNTFYFIVPTLPLFLIFPFLISRFGFIISIIVSIISVIISVIIINAILKYFNV